MTETFKIVGLLILAGILGIIAMLIHNSAPRLDLDRAMSTVNSFDECVAAGNPVMESYPRQCISKDGRHFVEDIPLRDDPSRLEGGGPALGANGCAVAGCSGQLCVSADEAGDIMTTCEYRAEYACYAEASCEPQADGQCGWTQTPELARCLASPPALDAEIDLQVR